MVSKLDLAVIVTLAAGCALWIELGHRVVIDAPTPSELAAAAAAATAACPANDDVPYSADCLAFLFGKDWRASESVALSSPLPPLARIAEPLATPPCAEKDNVPYSASCLTYLQGATTSGMRWRVSAPDMPVPPSAPAAVTIAAQTRDDAVK